MESFRFEGEIGASKSIYNRALIISSFVKGFKILGNAQSEDVDLMQESINNLNHAKEFNCGAAGTVLRFLALRLARKKGVFKLKGTPRLMQRALQPLQQTLSQFGCESRLLTEDTLELDCDQWRLRGDGIWVPSGESSQFASAILLSAWDLDFPLHFVRSGKLVSDSYFQMTVDLVKSFGMQVSVDGSEVSVPAHQSPIAHDYQVECDVSSAFAVLAIAALAGEAWIKNFPEQPLQPDAIFITHMIRMGAQLEQGPNGLKVHKAGRLRGVDVDLINSPDLFPVLATLSCFAEGASQFRGLVHLKYKESNRFERVIELCKSLGAHVQGDEDGLEIIPPESISKNDFSFDASEDHRLVMAAAVAQAGGANVTVIGSGAVSKSFKGFEHIWPIC